VLEIWKVEKLDRERKPRVDSALGFLLKTFLSRPLCNIRKRLDDKSI